MMRWFVTRGAIAAVFLAVQAAPARAASAQASGDVFDRAIAFFGGRLPDVARYAATVDGFSEYLKAAGVRALSAAELTTPHYPNIAARLGFQNFLPPKDWWARGAALALLAQRLDEAAGEHITVRNWWRPPAYNQDPGVGGARNGDHPTATALDLDYPSRAARAKAERALRSLEAQAPWLGLSLGLGPQTTHVGIGSPRGHREWHLPRLDSGRLT
jgi:hypothetical protein